MMKSRSQRLDETPYFNSAHYLLAQTTILVFSSLHPLKILTLEVGDEVISRLTKPLECRQLVSVRHKPFSLYCANVSSESLGF